MIENIDNETYEKVAKDIYKTEFMSTFKKIEENIEKMKIMMEIMIDGRKIGHGDPIFDPSILSYIAVAGDATLKQELRESILKSHKRYS
jgi:hypothetical protein